MGSTARPSRPGKITIKGTAILKNEPMMGASLAERTSFAGEHALDHQKIGSPVTHCLHCAQTEDNAGPVNAHGVGRERVHRCPHVREILSGEILVDALDHAVPSAGFNQTENRDEKGPKPDQEELQDFIEDGGEKSASRYVHAYRQRR